MQRLELLLAMNDRLSRPLRAAGAQVTDFANKSQAAFGRIGVGGAALWGVGMGIKAALQPAIEVDRALGEVKSLGVAEQGLQKLRQASLDFTMSYGGAADEFIRSSYDIQSAIAGLTGNELPQFTAASALLAKGTKSNTQTITAYMGTMYGIFQKQANAMGKGAWVEQIAGQTATAVQLFKTDGNKMADAFSQLGANAQAAGIDAAEQFAILGQLQLTKGSGGEAGTMYKSFLSGVGNAQKVLGLNFTNQDGTMKGVMDILNLIQGKFGDLSKVADSDLLKKAFGTDEAVSMIKLLNTDLAGLESNITAFGNIKSMDKATEMALAMVDPWEQGLAVINGIRIEIGTQLLPVLYPFLNKANEGGKAFAKWLRMYPNITRAIGLLAAALLSLGAAGALVNITLGVMQFAAAGLAPVLSVVIKLFRLNAIGSFIAAGAMKVYGAALGYLRASMLASSIAGRGLAFSIAMVTWPILLIGAAIAVVVALVYKFWKPIKAFFSGFIQGFSEAWGEISKSSPLFAKMTDGFSKVCSVVNVLFGAIASLFTPVQMVGGEFNQLSGWGVASGRFIASALGVVLDLLELLWDALAIIGQGWINVWNAVDVNKPLESMKNVGLAILGVFENLWELMKASFASTYNWIIEKLNKIPGVSIDMKAIPAPEAMNNAATATGGPLLTGGQLHSAGNGGIAQQIRSNSENKTRIDQSQRTVNVTVERATPADLNEWMELHAY